MDENFSAEFENVKTVKNLDADDAGERGPDEGALQRGLAQCARKQVDVVHVLVHLPRKKVLLVNSVTG
jgi:hypothetical protein